MVILTARPVKFFNSKFIFAILASSLGAFQHGYHVGVLNIPYHVLSYWTNITLTKDEYHSNISETLFSLTMSIFYLAALLGALVSFVLAEHLGRKQGVIINNIGIFLGCILMSGSQIGGIFLLFFFGRIFTGFSVGVNSVLIPMYLIEIAPTKLRGCVGSFYQIFLAFGLLVSQIVSLPKLLGTFALWTYLFVVPLFPLVLQMCLLPLCPESPRFIFLTKGNETKAEDNLFWLRTSWYADLDMEELYEEALVISDLPDATIVSIFLETVYRQPLLISILTMAGYQLTGVLLFYAYSFLILLSYLPSQDISYFTISVGVVALVSACFGPLTVEVVGRRALLLAGYIGIIVATILFSIFVSIESYQLKIPITIVLMSCLLFVFGISVGAVTWIYPHELFIHNARPFGVALAAAVNWLLGFVVVIGFLPILLIIKMFMFWILVFFNVIFFTLTIFFCPETRNRSGIEILEVFSD